MGRECQSAASGSGRFIRKNWMLQGGVAADGGWPYQAVIKVDSADAPERISGPHSSAANLLSKRLAAAS